MKKYKYDIALSFAGEDRDFVYSVATILLEKGIKLFYDEFEEANLWGKNLYDYLTEIYSSKARYTVMFISKHYKSKLWTNLERKVMQSRAFLNNKEYILTARFDNTQIPGILPTEGYISLQNIQPIDLAQLIIKKLNS